MEKNVEWYKELAINRTLKSLEQGNMKGYYLKNRSELLPLLTTLIPEESLVGVGDSVSLDELGVLELLRNGHYDFLDKYDPSITSEEKKAIYIKNFSSDTFLSGSNAVTEAGELFNIDGNGSRIAPMLYGPKQVIIIVGTNKIVRNLSLAEERVRQYAAPIDAKRLKKNTPCTSLGYCVDCKHPERICNDFLVIKGQFIKDRIKVIIINETLGY